MVRTKFKRDLLTIPNVLTIMRIIAIPFLVWIIYLSPKDGPSVHHFWGPWLFTIIGFTDILDGYLARRWNQTTVMGKLLDPLADKLLVVSMLVALVDQGRVSGVLAVLLIVRDFAMSGLRSIASSENIIIQAKWWGKAKTMFQMIGLMFLLVQGKYVWHFGFASPLVNFNQIGNYSLYVATIVSYLGFILYFRDFIKKSFPK
jgi:CDP-diacylglycerol--glycerol-3-phosphate 3-phosphatidyltransferase